MTPQQPPDREIRLEVEVPGTPEQVWDAIATGPGISAWFVPARVAEREGGEVVTSFTPEYDEVGVVAAWEPPRRVVFAASAEGGEGLAFEWLVEARSGGTCVVRLVNSGFGSGRDWDDQYDSMTRGWRDFLDNLRLYLTHFAGRRCSTIAVSAPAAGRQEDAWASLTADLGIGGARPGDRRTLSIAGAAALSGVVERATERHVALLLDKPGGGIA